MRRQLLLRHLQGLLTPQDLAQELCGLFSLELLGVGAVVSLSSIPSKGQQGALGLGKLLRSHNFRGALVPLWASVPGFELKGRKRFQACTCTHACAWHRDRGGNTVHTAGRGRLQTPGVP